MVNNISRLFALLALIGSICGASEYRLDKSIVPISYNITIKPYMLAEDADKQFTFDGLVNITLKATEPNVRQIVLHKDYIDIKSTEICDANGRLLEKIDNEKLIYETATDKLTVPLSVALTANVNYQLRFSYVGQMRDGMAGLFRTSYIGSDGNIKWLGVTQAQRIDARVIFPCFDEPNLKAKFQFHISRPKNYNTITNTRLISSVADNNDRYLDHFEETPIMSTYLIAFIISEYTKRGDNEFAVYSRPENHNYTELSYSVGLKAIDGFNALFQQSYKELGNPILQYASSPKFPHNGMENWGLIIYSDNVLVKVPGYTDGIYDEEFTARIVVHETAHMWFGDSVTFAWWSYFWLNEAFARYYEYFMTHQLYPKYQLDQQFIVNQIHLIFGIDAISSTQPMTSLESSINTPSEIGYKFSSIAYAKGASIVRMMRNAMGGNNFDAAIAAYLKKNHLKSVEPADLFVYLKEHWPNTHNVDLDKFFYDWTEQVGFPTVFVNASDDLQHVTLSQKRFLLNATDGSNANLKYTIPITYATNSMPDFKNLTPQFYFNKSATELTFRVGSDYKWIVLNKQQSNYYRVFYDKKLLRLLQEALAVSGHSGIPAENRAQIVDDLFNFAYIDLLDYADVIMFMEYLAEETDYIPWYAAYAGLQRIVVRFTVEQLKEFSKFLGDVTQKVYAKLGFKSDKDTILDVYNRNKLISWLCKFEHGECNREAPLHLNQLMSSGAKPLPDFRETLYCSAARVDKYAIIMQWYQHETFESERNKLWRAASCTKNYRLHYEEAILNTETPLDRKLSGITQLYAENPENVTPMFELITEDIERLVHALGSWSSAANVINGITYYFTTSEQLTLLENFIENKGALFGSSITTLQKSVENVKTNLDWAEKRLSSTISYLKKRNGATLPTATYSMLTMFIFVLRHLY